MDSGMVPFKVLLNNNLYYLFNSNIYLYFIFYIKYLKIIFLYFILIIKKVKYIFK